ncbi:MAG: hypothetical protein EXR72_11085 [Myxococcales bacterium]|nr:hypothetical protein [Myxococcales bacterium]
MIPADHRVELTLPAELPTGPAEVIVLSVSPPEATSGRRPMGIDAGKIWIADDFDAPLPPDLRRCFDGDSDDP